MEALRKLVDEIRKEVSCCCSWSRYEAVNELLDEMENEMKVEVDIEAEDWVPKSLKESIEVVRDMVKYYEVGLANAMQTPPSYRHKTVQAYTEELQESRKDLEALIRVYNYYTPAEEHIT